MVVDRGPGPGPRLPSLPSPKSVEVESTDSPVRAVAARSDKKPRHVDSTGQSPLHFAMRTDGPAPIQMDADDEASCRCATPPPSRDGGATRPALSQSRAPLVRLCVF